MVLWEIAVGTAYFLGLKRTYRLALKLQRRIISPRYPRLHEFAYKRTKNVFDVALSVHKKIQQRDIEVGRNLGNSILRWLDRMKPSAQIRCEHPMKPGGFNPTLRNIPSQPPGTQRSSNNKPTEPGGTNNQLFSSINLWRRSSPTLMNGQYRHMSVFGKETEWMKPTLMNGHYRNMSVFRKEWMKR
ncbi:hypothetical protein AMTRI_Chr03g145510 [Amborella trichopoda]|uniref:Uncharacterized protein n=1 Tax=Amborella trichopoda TaxID=13333 RepID=U5CZE5_AMBTC|nr:uncharacterized protein LOC18443809 [Amborella trichopoda]ERN15519.1 hypothetical protein AMTR_s00048p00081140 [Amborella trichopoda]|eukprot:XP_006854052.1 uncharacterized protein LOC18443809 [Amborella trichopoda]